MDVDIKLENYSAKADIVLQPFERSALHILHSSKTLNIDLGIIVHVRQVEMSGKREQYSFQIRFCSGGPKIVFSPPSATACIKQNRVAFSGR